jgi:hypothetical protein
VDPASASTGQVHGPDTQGSSQFDAVIDRKAFREAEEKTSISFISAGSRSDVLDPPLVPLAPFGTRSEVLHFDITGVLSEIFHFCFDPGISIARSPIQNASVEEFVDERRMDPVSALCFSKVKDITCESSHRKAQKMIALWNAMLAAPLVSLSSYCSLLVQPKIRKILRKKVLWVLLS